ncbi:putative uncharacterized protein DDB_G0287113 isoform X3 [Anopheles merus]|uniref:putative uncharacterized protein DDB_G0287113 isoform X3 n=1 Tax=Anopheles merus TaxID=30066 RepID=UPI001BE4460D|nr:putative uncharacterized protein DDB_G0287113 isoform X3 [Anopheles merus]
MYDMHETPVPRFTSIGIFGCFAVTLCHVKIPGKYRNETSSLRLRSVPCRSRPIQTSTSTSLYTTLAATTTTTTTSTTMEPPTTPAEARQFSTISTMMPAQLTAEHTSPLAALLNGDILDQDRTSARPAMQQQHNNDAEEEHDEDLEHDQEDDEQHHELEEEDDEVNVVGRSSSSANAVAAEEDEVEQEEDEHEHEDEHEQDESDDEDEQAAELHHQQALAAGQDAVGSVLPEDIPVEQKLKQITKEIEQLSSGAGDRELRLDSRQSFLSLSDLIKNIRPAEKVVPQIDSSYANTMRVLGEPLSQRR